MTRGQRKEAILEFLNFVFAPRDLYELRALGSKEHGTMRWLGDQSMGAALAAGGMEERDGDVYYGLNPVKLDSVYASKTPHNEPFTNVHFTMGDKSADCRNLYLIDIDPVRPSGAAATEGQRGDAISTADDVQVFLSSRDWPEPTRIDSGNGIHLLYKGDRTSADGCILKFALKALAEKFDGSCKVDQSVFNAGRIARLPYTLNRKAQRRSTVISYPTKWEPLPAARVLHLGMEGGYQFDYGEPRKVVGSKLAIDADGMDRFIHEYPNQLKLDAITQRDGATYFALSECPFKGAPHRGQDCGAGKTCIILWPDGVGFKCFSDDCSNHTFADLLRLLYGVTGRRPSMQIWDDNFEALEARWGGVVHVTSEDPEQKYLDHCYDEGFWDCLPEGIAYQYLTTYRFPACFDPKNPADPWLPVIMGEYRRGQERAALSAAWV